MNMTITKFVVVCHHVHDIHDTLVEEDTHTLTELTDEKGAQCGFLVVVLNIHIDDVDWLVALLLSGIQIWGHTGIVMAHHNQT